MFTVLDTLYTGKHSIVQRCKDNTKQQVVVCKFHKDDYPSAKLCNKYHKEFQMGCKFEKLGVAPKCLELRKYAHSEVILFEDEGLISLADYITTSWAITKNLQNFLHLAIKLADALSVLHTQGITHECITPRHILLDSECTRIVFTDFGYASELNRDFQLASRTIPRSHLRYISPEQTGRMNKDVDYRTDFYSLGVVFYELLCQQPPFCNEDPLDLIYNHMAKMPLAPHLMDAKIPPIVSEIILTLLAKNAEERYQSSHGLLKDLNLCLLQVQKYGTMKYAFLLRQQDVSSKFLVNQKLYGRENEIEKLMHAFSQVSNGEASNLVLVYGYSGIGKTALINEVHKPLAKEKGYFISGKFDQFKRNQPYNCFVQAFRQLMLILLTEQEERVQQWKQKILTALGKNGAVITEVIPEVELIIGKQPAVPVLPPSESSNRFTQMFTAFIKAFAHKEHPLVCFFDDVQWADVPTLELIESILLGDCRFVLFIMSFRDNEVNSEHLLTRVIANVSRQKMVQHIALKPLEIQYVGELCRDTLKLNMETVWPLVELVYAKTQGNPFFVIMFLTTLAKDGLLYFNFKEGIWEWDMQKIKTQSITDNVVHMMQSRMVKFLPDTMQVLSFAATIGNKFDLGTLSMITEKPVHEVATHLWPAIKDGLILQYGDEIKSSPFELEKFPNIELRFLHDKVQQAAYDLLSSAERASTSLTIGRLLLKNTNARALEEKVFDILVHFQRGLHIIHDAQERLEIAKLYLLASKRARNSAAFESSFAFAKFGISLLPSDCWESNYDLTLELQKIFVQCNYLIGNYEESLKYYPQLVEKANTLLDKVSILKIQIDQLEMQQRFEEELRLTQKCLGLLGLKLPEIENTMAWKELWHEQHLGIRDIQKKQPLKTLIRDPEPADQTLLVIELLFRMLSPAYCFGDFNIMMCVSATSSLLSLQHGAEALSSPGFLVYAAQLLEDDEFDEGASFGSIAMSLVEKYASNPNNFISLFWYGTSVGWVEKPMLEVGNILRNGYNQALERGNYSYGCYLVHHVVSANFYGGAALDSIATQYDQAMIFLKKQNAFISIYGYYHTYPFKAHYYPEKADIKPENEIIETCQNQVINLGVFYVGKVIAFFWQLKRDSQTLHFVSEALRLAKTAVYGFFVEREFHFCAAMIYLDMLHMMTPDQASNAIKFVDKVIGQFTKLSAINASNFEYKLLLLQAEYTRCVEKNELIILPMYHKAIKSARKHFVVQYEALANEFISKYWIDQDYDKYARINMQEAYYLYKQWGSKLKTRYIRKNYREMVLDILDSDDEDETEEFWDETMQELSQFDVLTVIKSCKTALQEPSLEKYLDHMMKLVLQNSGAQRGIFILADPSEGKLLVVTENHIANTEIDEITAVPLENFMAEYSRSVIHYVYRKKENVIVAHDSNSPFQHDIYIHRIKSIMCVPVFRRNEFKGVLYLENNLVKNAFSSNRFKIVNMLTSQLITQLENAKFSQVLESKIEYKKLVTELQLVKKRLEEFIDILCHELRNPLNGIIGNTSIMRELFDKLGQNVPEEKISEVSELLECLKSVDVSSAHMLDIVNTVLSVSMLENQTIKLNCVVFNPPQMLSDVHLMFKANLKAKNIHLHFNNFCKSEIAVVGDPHRFKEVAINLLSNAIKFTPEHGVINISCEKLFEDEVNCTLHFAISDSGIGLTEEEKSKLFKAFSQANSTTYEKYGGSGLGLSISQRLITLMGGTIDVSSKKNEGSKFFFTIPFAKATVPKPKAANDAVKQIAAPPVNNESKVLVVEDNTVNLKLLCRLLSLKHVKFETAMNGEEAYQLFIARGPWKLVFMDFEMPVLNGFESSRKIRQWEQDNQLVRTPIIGVSANARKEYSELASEAGMDDFITKPFKPNEIYAKLGIDT